MTDNGIGMTQRQLDRCFDKFWQGESGDVRRFGGTGIGLFIVRSLVEGMGGTVRAESGVDDGSRFSFTLPRADAPSQQKEATRRGDRSIVREFMRQIGVPYTEQAS